MSEDLIEKSILEKFPHFNRAEQDLIKDIMLEAQNKSDRFHAAKKQFMDLLYSDLVTFYKWDATLEDRIRIRKRLLNIAGLFVVVPIDELRDLAHKAKLTLKKIVYESPTDPLNKERTEMHSYDLKYINGFETFFSKIPLDPHTTTLDFIAGNREKRQYPSSQFTVFLKNIQNEIMSSEYITASAEPLTQTILVSLYNPSGSPRDLITIGFDLVYESAFIDFFHNVSTLTPVSLLRNAHIVGRDFLRSAVDTCHDLLHKGVDLKSEFPLFLFEPSKFTTKDIDDLLQFVVKSLMPQIKTKITGWNKELGLHPDHDLITWGETDEKEASE